MTEKHCVNESFCVYHESFCGGSVSLGTVLCPESPCGWKHCVGKTFVVSAPKFNKYSDKGLNANLVNWA